MRRRTKIAATAVVGVALSFSCLTTAGAAWHVTRTVTIPPLAAGTVSFAVSDLTGQTESSVGGEELPVVIPGAWIAQAQATGVAFHRLTTVQGHTTGSAGITYSVRVGMPSGTVDQRTALVYSTVSVYPAVAGECERGPSQEAIGQNAQRNVVLYEATDRELVPSLLAPHEWCVRVEPAQGPSPTHHGEVSVEAAGEAGTPVSAHTTWNAPLQFDPSTEPDIELYFQPSVRGRPHELGATAPSTQ